VTLARLMARAIGPGDEILEQPAGSRPIQRVTQLTEEAR
jgi:hypothetical protein